MPKLTKRSVEALPIRETDYFAFDDAMPGFGVRVLPSGKKSYLVQYRAGGRTRRVALGMHGTVTVEQARQHGRDLLGRVARGENPAEEIAKHHAEPTMANLGERFFTEHVVKRCKPRTQNEYRRALDIFIKPALGSFKIGDVTRADISKLHASRSDIPYQANRTLGVLSKMFNLAEEWGLRPDGSNPCRHVKKYPERRKERYLTSEELTRLKAVLAECKADGSESPHVCAAFWLLLTTGRRLGEIQTLKWSYIVGGYMELPDSKVGAMRYPLAGPVRAMLARLERLPNNPYVIAGHVEGQHVTDLQKPWRRIRSLAGIPDVRIHDLRHNAASLLANRGVSLQVIGKTLGHKQIQTTLRYAHLTDETAQKAVDDLADGILGEAPIGQLHQAAE